MDEPKNKSECKRHPGNSLLFYCSDHFDWLCEECGQKHLDCRHVMFMPHIPEESLSLVTKLKEQKHVFSDSIEGNFQRIHAIESDRLGAIDQIQQMRLDFDRFVENLKNEINACHNEAQDAFRNQIRIFRDHLQTVQSHLSALDREIKLHTATEEPCRIHEKDHEIILNLAKTELCPIQSNAAEIPKKFHLLKRFATLLEDGYSTTESSSQAAISSFDVTTDSSDLTSLTQSYSQTDAPETADKETDTWTLPRRFLDQHVLLTKEIIIKCDENIGCEITGCAVIKNHLAALADFKNDCVKLVKLPDMNGDTEDALLHTLKLQSKPFDITGVEGDKVAVSLPHVKELQILSVGEEKLTFVRKMDTDTSCYGISFDGRLLILAEEWSPFPRITLISLEGEIIRRVEPGASGRLLSSRAWYTAAARDGTFYVTNQDQHTVTRLSLTGEVLGQHMFDGLKDPRAVCVHPFDGSVFICFLWSNCVLRMTPDGQEIQRFNKLKPRSICFTMRNFMIVGHLKGDTILIDELT